MCLEGSRTLTFFKGKRRENLFKERTRKLTLYSRDPNNGWFARINTNLYENRFSNTSADTLVLKSHFCFVKRRTYKPQFNWYNLGTLSKGSSRNALLNGKKNDTLRLRTSKTIPYLEARTYVALIWEYPPRGRKQITGIETQFSLMKSNVYDMPKVSLIKKAQYTTLRLHGRIYRTQGHCCHFHVNSI